MNKDSNSSNP